MNIGQVLRYILHISISNKNEEELVKLTLEENMSELKRSFHILTKGH